jgi:hypothetical protein
MAQVDIETPFGFQDKRKGRGDAGASALVEQNNYDNITDMRTRLAVINATKYTVARLDAMTKNDMQYALRVESDSAGII